MCLLSLKNFIDFIEEISYTENKVSKFGFSEGSSRVLFFFSLFVSYSDFH